MTRPPPWTTCVPPKPETISASFGPTFWNMLARMVSVTNSATTNKTTMITIGLMPRSLSYPTPASCRSSFPPYRNGAASEAVSPASRAGVGITSFFERVLPGINVRRAALVFDDDHFRAARDLGVADAARRRRLGCSRLAVSNLARVAGVDRARDPRDRARHPVVSVGRIGRL